MLQVMEKSVGSRAQNLLEEAKAQVPATYAKFLRVYDCRGDAKKNLKLILEISPQSTPSNQELLNGFNAWIFAILLKQREVFNEEQMAASVQSLTNPAASWQQFPVKSNLKGAILSSIIQTVEQFEQELDKNGKGKGKGILSFLKRK
jgi:hypothetical protein